MIEDFEELGQLVRAGFQDWEEHGDVRAVYHDGLVLFNYTSKAQFEGRWNWFERVSRGLILDERSGLVVARPFDKFFNWGEGGRTTDATLVEATEKLDGSLGILYRKDGEHRVATRGSFTGEQAAWATKHLHDWHDLTELNYDFTFLFEIIYPDNRIVVDYEGKEGLVLIGIRHMSTGYDFLSPVVEKFADAFRFETPRAFRFDGGVDEVLEAAEDLDGVAQEGWVLRFSDGQRFKVKGESYKFLHRVVTQFSFKHVLEAMSQGVLDDLLNDVPDELSRDVRFYRDEIEAVVRETARRVEGEFARAPKGTRKEFALWVRTACPQDAPYLFHRLDGRDFVPLVYKREFQD